MSREECVDVVEWCEIVRRKLDWLSVDVNSVMVVSLCMYSGAG